MKSFMRSIFSQRSQFFWHCATFRIFSLQRVPLEGFLISCSKLKCQKAQRVSPFMYFGTMRLFKILIFQFFSKFFLSPKGSPFNFFDILKPNGFSKSPKGPPLRFLSFRYSCSRLVVLLILQIRL